MNKNRIVKLLVIIGIFALLRFVIPFSDDSLSSVHLTGTTMGPIPYSVKYQAAGGERYQIEVDSILKAYNNALSTYIPTSEISQFNENDFIRFESEYFYPVLKASREVFVKSGGAFDPTVGPLVNAWGFGPNKLARMDSSKVDSLLAIVGFDNIIFDESNATKKKGMNLDFSAIAKGNAVDVVAEFLKDKGVSDFMVEIGGEVSCSGISDTGNPWTIGIQRPTMTSEMGDLFGKVELKDMALATSGNYRNYYVEDGKIIAHTISPFSGYNVSHNLLSASIFAKNCTLADAYATACMVIGLEKSKEMINSIDGVEGFFIYSDDAGVFRSHATSGVQEFVVVVE